MEKRQFDKERLENGLMEKRLLEDGLLEKRLWKNGHLEKMKHGKCDILIFDFELLRDLNFQKRHRE